MDRLLDERQLIRFSLYTSSQARILIGIGRKIIQCLDEGLVRPNRVEPAARDAYGLFWLWVLGAYEVIRTMSQHKACFVEPIQSEIATIKKSLHRIRIPFAKQELPGGRGQKAGYVYGELSTYTYDFDSKDEGYLIGGNIVWTRRTIIQFEEFIAHIERRHILGSLPLGKESDPV